MIADVLVLAAMSLVAVKRETHARGECRRRQTCAAPATVKQALRIREGMRNRLSQVHCAVHAWEGEAIGPVSPDTGQTNESARTGGVAKSNAVSRLARVQPFGSLSLVLTLIEADIRGCMS